MLLENAPIPEPSFVLFLAIVGSCDVLQQTPRSVTDAPPSLVTFPPEIDSVLVIPVTSVVVKTGGVAPFSFLHDLS
jgi:hypothetical protein